MRRERWSDTDFRIVFVCVCVREYIWIFIHHVALFLMFYWELHVLGEFLNFTDFSRITASQQQGASVLISSWWIKAARASGRWERRKDPTSRSVKYGNPTHDCCVITYTHIHLVFSACLHIMNKEGVLRKSFRRIFLRACDALYLSQQKTTNLFSFIFMVTLWLGWRGLVVCGLQVGVSGGCGLCWTGN